MLLSGHLEVLGPPPPPGHEEHEDPDIERHGEADEDHGPARDPGHQVTRVTAHRGRGFRCLLRLLRLAVGVA